jgi:hypothetical protein
VSGAWVIVILILMERIEDRGWQTGHSTAQHSTALYAAARIVRIFISVLSSRVLHSPPLLLFNLSFSSLSFLFFCQHFVTCPECLRV